MKGLSVFGPDAGIAKLQDYASWRTGLLRMACATFLCCDAYQNLLASPK